MDASEYREFIRDFLAAASNVTPDSFGDPNPRLHAYAIFRPKYRPLVAEATPFSGTNVLEAIATRVVPATSPKAKSLPRGRAVLVFDTLFDGEAWRIVGLGIPLGATTALLDPTSEAGIEQGANDILEFWNRWD